MGESPFLQSWHLRVTGSTAWLSCESQVLLQDASPKVMWVIVKKEAQRVQNAVTFLFMCVSEDYLEVF